MDPPVALTEIWSLYSEFDACITTHSVLELKNNSECNKTTMTEKNMVNVSRETRIHTVDGQDPASW